MKSSADISPPRFKDAEPRARCSQCGGFIPGGHLRYRQACETCGKIVIVCRLCVDRKAAKPDIVSIGCAKHPGYMA